MFALHPFGVFQSNQLFFVKMVTFPNCFDRKTRTIFVTTVVHATVLVFMAFSVSYIKPSGGGGEGGGGKCPH